ncbi:MAG: hypothetical protein KAW93_09115 [Methanogenium sp.]|nr:hypothetical protein [Methanogenium sp.]
MTASFTLSPDSGLMKKYRFFLFQKLGCDTVVLHRPIGERIKTCTIRRSRTRKWDVSFSVEYDPDPTLQKNDLQTEEAVGIHVALKDLATTNMQKSHYLAKSIADVT